MISAFTFQVLELLNVVLTTVTQVFTAGLMQFYGRLGRCATPEVIVHLLSSKTYASLAVGSRLCPINVTELRSLKHPVTMAFIKICSTNSIDIVRYCQSTFSFQSVREQVLRHKFNF